MVIYATSSPVFRSYLRPECGGVDVALPATLRISVVEIPGPARRLSDWRDLRHQRGIMEFQRDITADNFTNPPSRVATFEAFKTEQMARHEIRCEVLKRLGVMTNDTLASTTVDNIRTSFHQVRTNTRAHTQT